MVRVDRALLIDTTQTGDSLNARLFMAGTGLQYHKIRYMVYGMYVCVFAPHEGTP